MKDILVHFDTLSVVFELSQQSFTNEKYWEKRL